MAVGILNESLFHPRETFRFAVLQNAYGVILIHNHPSGNPTPSDADRQQYDVTNFAKTAGFKFRFFLTSAVMETFVKVPHGVEGQDARGRLWDICWMLHLAIKKAPAGADPGPTREIVKSLYSAGQENIVEAKESLGTLKLKKGQYLPGEER